MVKEKKVIGKVEDVEEIELADRMIGCRMTIDQASQTLAVISRRFWIKMTERFKLDGKKKYVLKHPTYEIIEEDDDC